MFKLREMLLEPLPVGLGFTNHDLYGVHNKSICGLYMQGGNMFALLWY